MQQPDPFEARAPRLMALRPPPTCTVCGLQVDLANRDFAFQMVRVYVDDPNALDPRVYVHPSEHYTLEQIVIHTVCRERVRCAHKYGKAGT